MKINGIAYVWIGVIIIMAAVIGLSLPMPYVQSKALPLLISSFVFILAVVALWGELLAKNREKATAVKEEKDGGGEEEEFSASGGRYVMGMVWTAGFIMGVYLSGFLVAVPGFILVLMIKRFNMKWLTSITYAAVTTAIVYGTFTVLLGVTLYRGLFLELLGY